MWCFFKKHYSKYFILHFIIILYFPYILILLKKYICKIAELQLIFFFANLQFLFFKVNVNNMKKITTLQFFFNVKSIKRGLGHHFIQKNVGVVNLSPYNPTIWSIYVYSATENSFLYHIRCYYNFGLLRLLYFWYKKRYLWSKRVKTIT